MYSTISLLPLVVSKLSTEVINPKRTHEAFFHFYFHVLGAVLKNKDFNLGKTFLNAFWESDWVLIQQKEFVVFQEVLGSAHKLSLIVSSQSKQKGTAFNKQGRVALWLE